MLLVTLRDGAHFSGTYALKSAVHYPEGDSPRLAIVLGDSSGQRKGVIWKPTSTQIAMLSTAEVVTASGRVNPPGRYAGDITIEQIDTLRLTDALLDMLLPPFPESHQRDIAQLDSLIDSVIDPLCKRLLETMLRGSKRGLFINAVAAREVHHAYRGGLVQHTVEVATICDQVCQIYPRINRDVLITGALLHDFAKLDEMTHGLRAGEYTENGLLVGHVADGAARIIHETLDWPESKRNHLVHLILSHHERLEHGAAKVPSTPEAVVLAHADAISAHVCLSFRAVDTAPTGATDMMLVGRRWATSRP